MRLRSLLAVVLAFLAISAPAQASPAPGGSFTDDDGNTHEAAIEAIATIGVTRGCNPPQDDHYCPDGQVRRDQVAAFIARARSLPPAPPGNPFTDDTGIFEDDIERLAAAGITKGCNPPANDRYCPDRPVTRAEFAALMARAFDLPPAPPGNPFTDDTGVFEDDIERLAAAGITKGCNPPANDRFCPGDPLTRAQTASFFARALGLPQPAVPPRTERTASLAGSGYGVVTWVGGLPGDARTFVADTSGRIRVLGSSPGATVLDIRSLVSTGGERGLLGVAVHPSGDGRVMVAYTDTGGDSRVVEYEWSGSSLVSPRLLLQVDQPRANHNGGSLAFDDAGNLFIAVGDGGGGGDPDEHGQNPSTLLGSVLRVVPVGDDFPGDSGRNYTIPDGNPFASGIGGDPAVWLWGVRNPWRIHHDAGLLYVADVGQDAREEVTVVPAAGAGGDLGWDRLEGTRCYEPGSGCSTAGTITPVLEYTHAEGCSITGGVVTPDGPADVTGSYLYADFCSGWVRSFEMVGGVATQRLSLGLGSIGRPTTFGIGPGGSVYVGNSGGQVYEIRP